MTTLTPAAVADAVEGTGFKSNGHADALREQIDEPRRTFKPKPCATCGELIENPTSGAQKYHDHDGCKPARAAAKTTTTKPAEGTKGDQPGKATRRNGKRNGKPRRKPPTPAANGLLSKLSADCDQELARLDGELKRIEQGIKAMRDEQERVKADRARVARAQTALA